MAEAISIKTKESDMASATTSVGKGKQYILALDVGTTSIRAHIYDSQANILGVGSTKIELLHPAPGLVEMDEEVLWTQVQQVIKEALTVTNLNAKDMACLGITTQRNTFITWDKDTGKPFHHFITWQDLRASDLVKSWNSSYTMKGLNNGSKVLYWCTRKKRFLAASVLRYKSAQVSMRLLWQLENNAQLKKRISEQKVMYGCIDTWLLWKLTAGKVFATEYSCASSSGIYDPFQMEWSTIVSGILGIPLHIMPPTKDTSGLFGHCSADIFGAEIPITAMIADQQAAMFGQCCFNVGDVKVTMGTGSFVNCNTGNKPHASIAGLYPLIAWKIGKELVFTAEGLASDTGFCIEWAKSLGLFKNLEDLDQLVRTVDDSGGVYFVPAFSGIQAPINDDKACTALLGINSGTTQVHIVRAIIESLAFRFKLLYDTVLSETKTQLSQVIKCDGGVTNNNFLVELMAGLTQKKVDRPKHLDMTSLGAAFLAGMAIGIWKDKEELRKVRQVDRVFKPDKKQHEKYKTIIADWEKAVKRTKSWHTSFAE